MMVWNPQLVGARDHLQLPAYSTFQGSLDGGFHAPPDAQTGERLGSSDSAYLPLSVFPCCLHSPVSASPPSPTQARGADSVLRCAVCVPVDSFHFEYSGV